ncbi:2-hydroxyacid dehydrogenase [Eisenibacter elegans]|uniref:2-hydroxyacid dehydrogenase n=1 Tax=Eisenibacter elegans TaxID=997 RepID=UPI00041CB7DA|nr:2-hydroxyacid dehydrogenase [Eisenibacter elegans]
MPPLRVLIVDKMHPSITPLFASLGCVVDYQPQWTRTETLAAIEAYEGLVIRSKFDVDEALLQQAKHLRFIARAGSGMDIIDMDAASRLGIQVFNAPEGNRDAVAEHTLGMLLMLFNRLHLAHAQVQQKIWDREGNRGIEIKGKTVAIIGYGHVGQAVAQRLRHFECRILAYDKYDRAFGDDFVQEASMEQVFAEADILSLHVPLTAETYRMVDAAYLARFQKPIYLINTSRGEVVILKDLVQMLEQGQVLGACLDVLENEKIMALSEEQQADFESLAQHPRVILTPHVAGWTHESYQRINEVLTNKLRALLNP